jgi:hypothetical protein
MTNPASLLRADHNAKHRGRDLEQAGFIEALSIFDIYRVLGGGEVRHGRGRAFWRNGSGFNVALNAAKGVWYDFVTNEGGGILRLVEVALGCDRKAAFQWLADFAGVPFRHLTAKEQHDYARRRNAAKAEAAALVAWREQMIDALVAHRDLAFELYHVKRRAILRGDYETETEFAEILDECEAMEAQYQLDDQGLDFWRNTSWDHVLLMFRQRRQVA